MQPQKAETKGPTFLTVAEAAKIIRMSPLLLYAYMKEKKGPKHIRFGRYIRIRADDFEEWCAKDHPPIFKQGK